MIKIQFIYQKGKKMPLSFFWGEEDFLIEKEIKEIKERVLKEDISELNFKTADNPDFSTLIFLLRSQPMMFGESVYVIKMDKYFLEASKKVKLDDKQTEELIEAVDLISDKIHIIMTCPIPRGDKKKPDSRKKFYKAIQKKGEIKEFPAFKAYEEYKILPVLKNLLKDYNLKAGNDALEELVRRTGPYLRDLNSALDKISLYVYPENFIDKKTVGNLYSGSRNIFSLIDLILEKNYEKTLFEISNMLQKSHYLEILAFLQSGFSKILMTKIYSKKMSSFEIAKKTGQNEYAVKMSLNKIKNTDLKEIIRLKQNLTRAEFEIKTGEKEVMTAFLEMLTK